MSDVVCKEFVELRGRLCKAGSRTAVERTQIKLPEESRTLEKLLFQAVYTTPMLGTRSDHCSLSPRTKLWLIPTLPIPPQERQRASLALLMAPTVLLKKEITVVRQLMESTLTWLV